MDINWSKFLWPDQTVWSDNVYRPTLSNLVANAPFLPHQSSILNASPLDNADDRRFAIAQLSAEQRNCHPSTSPAQHILRIQTAIDTLVNYYKAHEKKPLSSYDRFGWPGKYNSKNGPVDRQRSSFERMRRRDEAASASVAEEDVKVNIGDDYGLLADDSSSNDSSESATNPNDIYDFSESLQGLFLDPTNGLFEAVDSEKVFAAELSLSPASQSSSPSRHAVPDDILPSSNHTPILAQVSSSASASHKPSCPPLLASTNRTPSNRALSIANLIHHNAWPGPISPSTNPDYEQPESEIDRLLYASDGGIDQTTLSYVSLGLTSSNRDMANANPPVTEPLNRPPRSERLNPMRLGLAPVPLRNYRTYKAHRMRRGSLSRRVGGKAEDTSRDGSRSAMEKEKAQYHKAEQHTGTTRRNSSESSNSRFQPYSYEYGGTDWSQPIERDGSASTTSYAADPRPTEESHSNHTVPAHQLPTSAIKYEPLDEVKMSRPPQGLPQQQGTPGLKRKDRDDGEDENRASSRPRIGSNSWTISGAPYGFTAGKRWPAP